MEKFNMKKNLLLILLSIFVLTQSFAEETILDKWQKIYDVNDWGETIDSYSYCIWESAQNVKSNDLYAMRFFVRMDWTCISIILPGKSYNYQFLLSDENKVATIKYRNKQTENSIDALIWDVYDVGTNTAVDIVPLRTGTVKTIEPIHGFRDIYKLFITNTNFEILLKINSFQVKATFKGLELNKENIELYLLMAVIAPDIESVRNVFKLDKNILYSKRDSEILLKTDYFSTLHTNPWLINKWLDNTEERDEILKILKENGIEQLKNPIDQNTPIYKSYQY